VKGSSCARAKSSAADGFQPTGLPGKTAVTGCSLPNITTVQAGFCRAFMNADLAHSGLCHQTTSLARAEAAEHAGPLWDPLSLQ